MQAGAHYEPQSCAHQRRCKGVVQRSKNRSLLFVAVPCGCLQHLRPLSPIEGYGMHTIPKMKKFPVSVPDDLHRRFKIKCAIEGVMMSEVVRRLLERECEAIGETNSCPLRASAKSDQVAIAG